MKVAIIGSRYHKVPFGLIKETLPGNTTLIISGGAKGIDTCARNFAKENNIPFTEYLPEKDIFGRYLAKAFQLRNSLIFNNCEFGLIFWDGRQRKCGTYSMIKRFERSDKPFKVIKLNELTENK